MRSIDRAGRRALALVAGFLLVAFGAAPALACGGLIGPNGAVNLLRTTTFAGYHAGEEHYVTAFEFAGGGGAFGSLTPLPGVPTSVEKGGDWTLQRLARETQPLAQGALLDISFRAAAPSATELDVDGQAGREGPDQQHRRDERGEQPVAPVRIGEQLLREYSER